VNVDKLLIGPI